MNTHPYEPFIPEKATKLIIGSIPPQRFCNYADKAENALLEDDVDFYYGSRDNSFWQLLGEVFGVEFERANTQTAIEQRKSFLTKNGFGITDLVDICSRIEGSSKDSQLGITKHKDLFQLLSDHPAIDTLIYTSNFVKSEVNAIIKGWHTTAGDSGKEFTVKINDKVYKVKVLYSPSPNALRNMGPDGKERRRNQYKSFLKAD